MYRDKRLENIDESAVIFLTQNAYLERTKMNDNPGIFVTHLHIDLALSTGIMHRSVPWVFFVLFGRFINLFYICAWVSNSSFSFCASPLKISIFFRGSTPVFLGFLYHLPFRDSSCLYMSGKILVGEVAVPWRNIAKDEQNQLFHSTVLYLRNWGYIGFFLGVLARSFMTRCSMLIHTLIYSLTVYVHKWE